MFTVNFIFILILNMLSSYTKKWFEDKLNKILIKANLCSFSQIIFRSEASWLPGRWKWNSHLNSLRIFRGIVALLASAPGKALKIFTKLKEKLNENNCFTFQRWFVGMNWTRMAEDHQVFLQFLTVSDVVVMRSYENQLKRLLVAVNGAEKFTVLVNLKPLPSCQKLELPLHQKFLLQRLHVGFRVCAPNDDNRWGFCVMFDWQVFNIVWRIFFI